MKHIVVVLTFTITILLFSSKVSASTGIATSQTPDNQVIAQSAQASSSGSDPAESNVSTNAASIDVYIQDTPSVNMSPALSVIVGLVASALY